MRKLRFIDRKLRLINMTQLIQYPITSKEWSRD